jgi:hypothetical protein
MFVFKLLHRTKTVVVFIAKVNKNPFSFIEREDIPLREKEVEHLSTAKKLFSPIYSKKIDI